MVTFESPVEDLRDFTMKKSMQFQAYGRHHFKIMDLERARAQVFTAYAASFMQNSGQYQPLYGCGILKDDSNFHHHRARLNLRLRDTKKSSTCRWYFVNHT